jgi:hypothetical protein
MVDSYTFGRLTCGFAGRRMTRRSDPPVVFVAGDSIAFVAGAVLEARSGRLGGPPRPPANRGPAKPRRGAPECG